QMGRISDLSRRPIITVSIGREAPLPSLRGAIATKPTQGPRDAAPGCFAALAMTGWELARLFLGLALVAALAEIPQSPSSLYGILRDAVAEGPVFLLDLDQVDED